MKKIKLITFLIGVIISPYLLQSQDYKLNQKESSIIWTGKAAFNSYALTGTIKPLKGTLSINKIEITNLSIVIDMKSLDHENKDLKKHLKSEDFFEVKTYPTAAFIIQNPSQYSSKKTIVSGMLRLKNKSNIEKIPVSIDQSDSKITLTFEYEINRTEYGINHNSPSIFKRLKENAIADKFMLKGKLVFDL